MRALRRKPRTACPLRPLAAACVAFGSEGACMLCDMIDFDHPTTAVTLGLPGAPGLAEDREAAFTAHLERAMRGGWTPKRGTSADRAAFHAGLYGLRSPLPIEAPF